jgi:hypothetical protein
MSYGRGGAWKKCSRLHLASEGPDRKNQDGFVFNPTLDLRGILENIFGTGTAFPETRKSIFSLVRFETIKKL